MLTLDATVLLLGRKIFEADQRGLSPKAVVFSEDHLAALQDPGAEFTTFYGVPFETVPGDGEPSIRTE